MAWRELHAKQDEGALVLYMMETVNESTYKLVNAQLSEEDRKKFDKVLGVIDAAFRADKSFRQFKSYLALENCHRNGRTMKEFLREYSALQQEAEGHGMRFSDTLKNYILLIRSDLSKAQMSQGLQFIQDIQDREHVQDVEA